MLDLIIFIILLWAWYAFWSYAEKKNFKEIKQKESELKDIIIITKKDAIYLWATWNQLLTSSIVISSDYFKRFIAWFISFFGGEMTVYESLLDRARRWTIVKLKQTAKANWFNCLANLKLETSSISKWAKWQIWAVEILAYATAVNLPERL